MFHKNVDGLESFMHKQEKVMRSERRYAAFMFVPIYIMVLWLVFLAGGRIGEYYDDNKAFFREESGRISRKQTEKTVSYDNGRSSSFGTVNEAEPDGRIEIDSASAELLEALPGVGEYRAGKIVEAREKLGGFRTVDDLMNVDGIGEKTLEMLRDYAYVVY